MRIDRAAKFGLVGAVGAIAISLATFGLARIAWMNRTAGFEGRAMGTVAIVLIAGVAVTLMFLFGVIGVFVDRKLAARGIGPEDEE